MSHHFFMLCVIPNLFVFVSRRLRESFRFRWNRKWCHCEFRIHIKFNSNVVAMSDFILHFNHLFAIKNLFLKPFLSDKIFIALKFIFNMKIFSSLKLKYFSLLRVRNKKSINNMNNLTIAHDQRFLWNKRREFAIDVKHKHLLLFLLNLA